MYSAEDTCVIEDFSRTVSCSAQPQFIADHLQYFGLALGETLQLSLPWAKQELGEDTQGIAQDSTEELL